jgi:hypothetical protein
MMTSEPITVAARSKAWIVFARSSTGVLDSNLTRDTEVCVFILFVLFCLKVVSLRRADLPSKESYRLCID